MKKEKKSTKFFLVFFGVQKLFVFLFCWLYHWGHIYKLSSNQRPWRLNLCLLLGIYSFCTYIHFINFWVTFCICYETQVNSLFCMWHARCLSIICRKDFSFPSCSLITNQLTVGIGVWFCHVNFIWLVYMSILISLWYYFDYYTFAIHFEIEKFKSIIFVLFCQDDLMYFGFLEISYEF